MDKFLKPERLDVSPNSPSADRDFTHWYRTFAALIRRSTQASDIDKLDALITFVSPSVYEYIAECDEYETALNLLKDLYIKPKNEVYARHELASRCQKEDESIVDYVRHLQLLGKECNFKAVSAIQNREDCIRDAFIRGLRSQTMRQRLLENRTLDLTTAVDQARAMGIDPKQSESYTHHQMPAINSIMV